MPPLPDLPARDRPDAWKSGRFLPLGEEEKYLVPAGFPFYRYDVDTGNLWHLPGPDARGHRRARRRVRRLIKSGCHGWNLRRNGCAVWVGEAAMEKLLKQA